MSKKKTIKKRKGFKFTLGPPWHMVGGKIKNKRQHGGYKELADLGGRP